MNNQLIEKSDLSDGNLLAVHSIFYTIQGEGPFCGTPAVFIRLAGCNLQCPACDTDYTSTRTHLSPLAILQKVASHISQGLVVITGGEPFRQDLRFLFAELLRAGYYVQVETNGTLRPSAFDYTIDITHRKGVFIVCSPKAGKINEVCLSQVCALKYVLHADAISSEDGLPTSALGHSAHPILARPPADWDRLVYLQPEDSQDEEQNRINLNYAVKACLHHGYILQIQLHKYLGVL